MKLLILGGTRFLGRHLAQQALDAGHDVTLLHRGRSNSTLFPQAEHLLADRNGDLSLLSSRQWDAAIDTNAYVPRHVRSMAAALLDSVEHYQLVSTISVYADDGRDGQDEDAPLQVLDDPLDETVSGARYGGLKVLCEEAAVDIFGERCLISRPGLLVGPHDPTGRLTWWLQRAQRGGEMLAPGEPDTEVQFIDARDAAAWMLLQAARGSNGIFNLTGPAAPLTMGGLLDSTCEVLAPAGTDTRLEWVDESFLLEHGVAPWTELPLWLPADVARGHRSHIERALATGLECRPLLQTLADTAAWDNVPTPAGAAPNEGPPRPPVGLAPEREAALLAAWHSAQGRR